MTLSRCSSFSGSIVGGAAVALAWLLAATPAGALTLSAEAAADFDKTVAAESLAEPVDMVELPDGRLVIIQRTGDVLTYTPSKPDDEPVQSHIDVDSNHNERGLLGVVIDPDFATNQFIYFYASQGNDANNRQHILRYKLGEDGKIGSLKVVVDMGLRGPANHNGGGISIYRGNLFIGVGDTGNNNDIPHNHFASCLNLANGKVLRVSLAEATLGQPVADNPLMDVAMVSGCDSSGPNDDAAFEMRPPERRIYAWGFRNPFRVWADPKTGKVWVGDVGETSREEVSVVDKGKHYGYPFVEGTKKYTTAQQEFQPDNGCMGLTPASECIAPVHDYARAGGGSVMGGRILDGCGWPAAWTKRYIFGDHEQQKVWTLDVNDDRSGVVADSLKEFASTDNVTAMKMGTDNALYIVERSGTVTRITAKAAPPAEPGSCTTVDSEAPSSGGGGAGAGGAAGASSGGASSAGASGSPSATGGAATGGGGAGAPAAGAGGAPAKDDGCGCRVASGAGASALGLGTLALALGAALARRRRNRARA